MVLDQGRQVFFGPPSEARTYFENIGYKALPRQSTPDYLTGCTDPNERQFSPGRSAQDVPVTPEALERTFNESSHGQTLKKSLDDFKELMTHEKADQESFRAAIAAEKRKGVSKKSPYTLGFFGQTKAITSRQFQQKIQDQFFITTSFLLSTVSALTSPDISSLHLSQILALVIGGAFFNQQLTAQGAFVRGR